MIALVGSTFLVIFFCFAGGNELSLVSSLFFFDLKLQVREWPFFIDAADIIYFYICREWGSSSSSSVKIERCGEGRLVNSN